MQRQFAAWFQIGQWGQRQSEQWRRPIGQWHRGAWRVRQAEQNGWFALWSASFRLHRGKSKKKNLHNVNTCRSRLSCRLPRIFMTIKICRRKSRRCALQLRQVSAFLTQIPINNLQHLSWPVGAWLLSSPVRFLSSSLRALKSSACRRKWPNIMASKVCTFSKRQCTPQKSWFFEVGATKKPIKSTGRISTY